MSEAELTTTLHGDRTPDLLLALAKDGLVRQPSPGMWVLA